MISLSLLVSHSRPSQRLFYHIGIIFPPDTCKLSFLIRFHPVHQIPLLLKMQKQLLLRLKLLHASGIFPDQSASLTGIQQERPTLKLPLTVNGYCSSTCNPIIHRLSPIFRSLRTFYLMRKCMKIAQKSAAEIIPVTPYKSLLLLQEAMSSHYVSDLR